MSSDDSGFDKEAEREKLREQYEQDKKDRENTQRMSELLLQGATMTGKHCGECGDPIFRYDGQEFCPTCQREVAGDAGAEGAEEPATDQGGDAHAERAETDAEPDVDGSNDAPDHATESGGEPRVEINDVRVADGHADRSDLRDPPSRSDGRTGDRRSADRRETTRDRPNRRSTGHRSAEPHPTRESAGERRDSADDLEAARESLVRTLTDLSRRAEQTDDVARTRDLLAATREAAEALAALDRANR